ncbi:hypothetical protein [Bacillus massilinigeriensis]|uniref:hypothetical protein n=1 Tax=Bacillus massilionigeriensis TaxID=1805475 RepID=UPI00096B4577|nr:hypothetical protein [Bacillus massilionigeriensis]
MNTGEVYKSLVFVYTDFYDGLYTKDQLKFMLRRLHKNNPHISSDEFAQLCLEAQWENASEEDYENTRKINEESCLEES